MVRRIVIKRTPVSIVPSSNSSSSSSTKPKAKPKAKTKADVGAASTKLDIPGLIGDPPSSIKNGEGTKVHADQRGVVTVTLDPGAYRLLWEIAESTAASNYRKYDGVIPELVGASIRAVNALRSAQVVIPEPKTKRRRSKATGS